MNPTEPQVPPNPMPPTPPEPPQQPVYPATQTNPASPVVGVGGFNEKPPVGVQILYGLSWAGLILGLLLCLFLALVGTSTFLSGPLRIIAGVLAVIIILTFLLIRQIRQGKKWALIVYSVIFVLGFIETLTSRQSPRVGTSILTAVLLGYIWIKERDYFH